jgi:enterochelin esterase-like enzyme
VNSESMGPWGDAIMYELLPHIESTFHGIGEGWARFCYGGSTGGWESLAVQLKYPDVRLILH